MSYLYAAMGISMITGIMAMIEMSNSLSTQNLYNIPPKDEYINSTEQNADRLFDSELQKAKSSWGTGKELCNKLKLELQEAGFNSIVSKYKIDSGSESTNNRLSSSCILYSNKHRIIISSKNPNINSYGLYSCLLDNEAYCEFEKNKP